MDETSNSYFYKRKCSVGASHWFYVISWYPVITVMICNDRNSRERWYNAHSAQKMMFYDTLQTAFIGLFETQLSTRIVFIYNLENQNLYTYAGKYWCKHTIKQVETSVVDISDSLCYITYYQLRTALFMSRCQLLKIEIRIDTNLPWLII